MSAYSRMLNQHRWWRVLRWEVMARAGGVCEVCHKNDATEVHHLVYPVSRRERASDLYAICNDCHYRLHFPRPADNDNTPQLPLAIGED